MPSNETPWWARRSGRCTATQPCQHEWNQAHDLSSSAPRVGEALPRQTPRGQAIVRSAWPRHRRSMFGCASRVRRRGDTRQCDHGRFDMRRLAWLLAISIVAHPCRLLAQATATTAQIEGVITDQQGAAMPGVSVAAKNVGTGFERTATSDTAGLYRLNLLPLGTYEVTAQLQGFATVKREGLVLQVGETLVVPISMRIAAVSETLT